MLLDTGIRVYFINIDIRLHINIYAYIYKHTEFHIYLQVHTDAGIPTDTLYPGAEEESSEIKTEGKLT